MPRFGASAVQYWNVTTHVGPFAASVLDDWAAV